MARPFSPYSSPSAYFRDDLLDDLSVYARDIPPSSTPTLSHGTSSSFEDRLSSTDSPGVMSRGSLEELADAAGEVRKRQRSEEQCGHMTDAPRLSTNGSWYLRSQSDPASYIPSWTAPTAQALIAYDDRPLKRARVLSLSPPAISRSESAYAREPAALRKARSLRSDASQQSILVDKSDMSVSPYDRPVGVGAEYIPTRPSTPAPVPVVHLTAPLVWTPARSDTPEDVATRRLKLLLDKEARVRRELGLSSRFDRMHASEIRYAYGEDGVYTYADEETEEEPAYDTDLNPRLVEGAVEWTLTVQPPANQPFQNRRLYSEDLHAQLVDSPETPFFAAMLFRIYWVVESARAKAEMQEVARFKAVIGGAVGAQGGGGEKERATRGELEGERELAFDYALAAVALAVKFDRDVLRPLRPVYARDFMRIAPHDVCFEELESAQWHILRALSLELNLPMPGSLLSELRLASIPLRVLVPAEWMWDILVKDVWWMLGLAARQKDVLRYPASLLTISALTQSLERLTSQRLSDSSFDCGCVLREPLDADDLHMRTSAAIEDVTDLCGWSSFQSEGAMEWVGGLVREAERCGRRGALSVEEY